MILDDKFYIGHIKFFDNEKNYGFLSKYIYI